MKNLLKLGHGPRPDLMFEENEKENHQNTQAEGTKKKIEFEKGIRAVRKEAKQRAKEERKRLEAEKSGEFSENEEEVKKKQKQALDEMSRQDKMAMMMAFAQLILPVAVGVLAIFAFLIWFLGKFWLHAW